MSSKRRRLLHPAWQTFPQEGFPGKDDGPNRRVDTGPARPRSPGAQDDGHTPRRHKDATANDTGGDGSLLGGNGGQLAADGVCLERDTSHHGAESQLVPQARFLSSQGGKQQPVGPRHPGLRIAAYPRHPLTTSSVSGGGHGPSSAPRRPRLPDIWRAARWPRILPSGAGAARARKAATAAAAHGFLPGSVATLTLPVSCCRPRLYPLPQATSPRVHGMSP